MDVALTTTGTHMTKRVQEACLPHLSWVKFSVDAGNPQDYARIHRVQPDKYRLFLSNLEECARFKRESGLYVTLGTQFLILPGNIRGVKEAI